MWARCRMALCQANPGPTPDQCATTLGTPGNDVTCQATAPWKHALPSQMTGWHFEDDADTTAMDKWCDVNCLRAATHYCPPSRCVCSQRAAEDQHQAQAVCSAAWDQAKRGACTQLSNEQCAALSTAGANPPCHLNVPDACRPTCSAVPDACRPTCSAPAHCQPACRQSACNPALFTCPR